MLLTICCPKQSNGWLAEVLVEHQTIDNLERFGDLLEAADEFVNATPRQKEKAKVKFLKIKLSQRRVI